MQLSHDQVEGTPDDHGYVAVSYGETELVRHRDFQHNRNFRARFELCEDLVETVAEKIAPLLAPPSLPTFIESNIPTKAEFIEWLAIEEAKLKSKAAAAA